mgnify:CR=1 FL=1
MTVYVQLLKYHRVEEGIGPDLHGAVPNTLTEDVSIDKGSGRFHEYWYMVFSTVSNRSKWSHFRM